MKINFAGIFYQILSIQICPHAIDGNIYTVQYADPKGEVAVKVIMLSEKQFREMTSFV